MISDQLKAFSIDHPPPSNRSRSPGQRVSRRSHLSIPGLRYHGRSPDRRRRTSPEKKLLTPEIVSGQSSLSSPWKGIPRRKSRTRNKSHERVQTSSAKPSSVRAVSNADDSCCFSTTLLGQLQQPDESISCSRKNTADGICKDFSFMRMDDDGTEIGDRDVSFY